MKIQVDVPTGEVEKALTEELKKAQRRIASLESKIKHLEAGELAAKDIRKGYKVLKAFIKDHFALYDDPWDDL